MTEKIPSQLNLSVAEALARVLHLAQPLGDVEPQVPLELALNRVLATSIVSTLNVPPHDNAAMDGFAFHSTALAASDSRNGMAELTVVAKALAGEPWRGTVNSGECVGITTGAVMPAGCDTVVPLEGVNQSDQHVRFPVLGLKAGENRRLCGEDIARGSVALTQGSILSPAALGLVASLGQPTVPVVRRLRVAYFSTGDEIMSLGQSPREGAVYDSNRFTMLGMLEKLGVERLSLGRGTDGFERHVVRDDPTALEVAFRDAAQLADVVITSGGVSVGEADHTKAIMRKLGDVEFWRIAMRPGRPMAFGTIKRPDGSHCLLFGLPGNPVAVMVTFLALVRPALQRMMGLSPALWSPAPLLQARCEHSIPKKSGRTEYQRGIVTTHTHGDLVVRITGNQGSGVLSSMVQANGLIVLEHDRGDVAVGETVNVLMLDRVL